MKLTQLMRDAFVRAAMADVPQVDYNEQAASLVKAHMDKLFAATFPGVSAQKLVDQGWLRPTNYSMPGYLNGVMAVGPTDYQFLKKDAKLWSKLEALAAKNQAQQVAHRHLEQNLRAVALSCTTVKALSDALPEFVKYMPADAPTAARNLPAVANVVAEFVKAGWPKDKQPAPQAA